MSKKRKKGVNRRTEPSEEKIRQLNRDAAQMAKNDIHGPPDRVTGWGTQGKAQFYAKATSEEARRVQCPDCGFSKGRHAASCQLK